jgi:xylulose-5-phosphate/fructose-6-phosphate phosphoketolase
VRGRLLRDKLIEHKQYIARYGDDMLDVRGWTWAQASTVQRADSTEADNV